ncbi:hypothetical protein SADUNF_Sadunf10G0088700 [Salix dunnii]|uniref:Protein kinase domain-containing protein n=1 Tax=Salix dunnii TaxID=1413687 RepID=A0A835MUL6_9ROSI|nr:hypothetical protein SADUNF_Sadunf10G0088700 [Salix dunnii]
MNYSFLTPFSPINQSLRLSNALGFGKNTSCAPQIKNISLYGDRFRLPTTRTGLFLFYNCNSALLENDSKLLKHKVNCSGENETVSTLAMLDDDPLLGSASEKCGAGVVAPVDVYRGENVSNIGKMLERGFVLDWVASNCTVCEESGGRCGFNSTTYHFKCFCPDRPHSRRCKSGYNPVTPQPTGEGNRQVKMVIQQENKKLGLKLGLGFGVGCLFAVTIYLSYIYGHRFRRRRDSSNLFSMNSSSDPSSKEDVEGDGVYLSIPIFSYTELGQATNNFDSEKELGDGGFGTVYYGKLKDGREVAVKRLYEHNYKRVKQFMNEIEILTRLHHKNLVCLYGCTSRRSRELLLVYEYIPNGTVADHLHGDLAKHRHEINLSNLAIIKIQKCAFDELIDSGLGYNSDEEVKRMTTSVAELAFQCLHHDKEMRPSMENVLLQLKIIQGGESLDNLEEVHDDNKRSTNTLPPPSPPYCDEAVLLKNILPPPSPVSVTAKWASSSSATPNEIV